jgi:hypothetical protein
MPSRPDPSLSEVSRELQSLAPRLQEMAALADTRAANYEHRGKHGDARQARVDAEACRRAAEQVPNRRLEMSRADRRSSDLMAVVGPLLARQRDGEIMFV